LYYDNIISKGCEEALMVKAKDGSDRQTYSVRLRPEVWKQLRHLAVDEEKTVGEVIEAGIGLLLQKKEK
jgi:hypothetical protein